MQENFLIQSQQLKDRTGSTEDNHSLTETFVRDAAGNAFEFGVSSDAQNATTKPTLFTTAWTAGNFDGYEAGFVSSTSVKPGSFNPPVGTSPEFGYWITGGNVWFTYGGKSSATSPSRTGRAASVPSPRRRPTVKSSTTRRADPLPRR